MNHAAALGNAADVTGLTPQSEFQGDFLGDGVGGHNGLAGITAAGLRQLSGQGIDVGGYRVQAQGQTDDAGGSHHHVLRGDSKGLTGQIAHPLGDFQAVGVAGIGVAAVADHCLGLAVGDVCFGHGQRGALDQIGGVYCCGMGGHLTVDQGQVLFGPVFPDAAVKACGGKSFCGADAAGNGFHIFFPPILLAIDSIQGSGPDPVRCSYSGWQRRKRLCPDCQGRR